jgi:hypothetical protein
MALRASRSSHATIGVTRYDNMYASSISDTVS